jgi:Flp pilus assembly protein TadB
VTGWGFVSVLALMAALCCWQAGSSRAPVAIGLANLRDGAHAQGRRPRGSSRPGVSLRARRLAAGSCAVLVLLVLPAPYGWLLAAAAAAGLDAWLARQPGRAEAVAAGAVRRQLPLALELMAAALSAGSTPSAALLLAADGCGPPISAPFHEAAASLGLGAAPEEAWRPLLRQPALRQLGRLAIRSTASGAAMAGACRELAGHEREARVLDAQVAIKRAGVLTVLPLALCFLPAFVLVGVVPIVVGLLRSLAL